MSSWTMKEVEMLKILHKKSKSDAEIAEVLGRTQVSVKSKRNAMGLRSHFRLSPEVIEKLLNMSTSDLEAEYGWCPDWIRRTKYRLRSKRGVVKPRRFITDSERWQMYAMRINGMKYKDIAQIFNCHFVTVWENVKKFKNKI